MTRRPSAATQRQKTEPPSQSGQLTPAVQAEPDASEAKIDGAPQWLAEVGWVCGENDAGQWKHETKTSGAFLPLDEAVEFELRSRAAAGGPSPAELDARQAVAEIEAERTVAAAAAELAAATVTIDEPVPGHDRLGRVVLWSCYQCKLQVRFSPDCDCETCERIAEGVCCPRCGDNEPNVQRRR